MRCEGHTTTITMMERVALGLGYLAFFGLGVTFAMTVFALLAASAGALDQRPSLRWGRRLVAGSGFSEVGAERDGWLGRWDHKPPSAHSSAISPIRARSCCAIAPKVPSARCRAVSAGTTR
jgi:hypothetical protein